jgi:hypothetical protein
MDCGCSQAVVGTVLGFVGMELAPDAAFLCPPFFFGRAILFLCFGFGGILFVVATVGDFLAAFWGVALLDATFCPTMMNLPTNDPCHPSLDEKKFTLFCGRNRTGSTSGNRDSPWCLFLLMLDIDLFRGIILHGISSSCLHTRPHRH